MTINDAIRSWNRRTEDELDIYVLDTMDHDEYMKAKKVLKKMTKMAKKVIKAMPSRTTYHNEMEENNYENH